MKTTISTKTNFNRTASLLLISILLVFLFGCKNVDKKNANSVDSEDKTATKEEFSTNKLGAAVLAKHLNDNTVTVSDTAVVIENNSEL
jgi:hypothetical protein